MMQQRLILGASLCSFSLPSGGNCEFRRLGFQPELHRADHRVGRLLADVRHGPVHQSHQQEPAV